MYAFFNPYFTSQHEIWVQISEIKLQFIFIKVTLQNIHTHQVLHMFNNMKKIILSTRIILSVKE